MRTLILHRIYLPSATLGTFLYEDRLLTLCLELPWRHNEQQVSCIPEGTYPITWENHAKFGQVYRLHNVPNRDGVLIHTGNELGDTHGCLLPAYYMQVDAMGSLYSKDSLAAIRMLMKNLLRRGDMQIEIRSSNGGKV